MNCLRKPFVGLVLTGMVKLSAFKKCRHVGNGGIIPLIFNISSG